MNGLCGGEDRKAWSLNVLVLYYLKLKESIVKASSPCIMTFKLFPIINMFMLIKYKRDSIILATTHRARRLVSKCSLMPALTELKADGTRRKEGDK